MQPVYGIICLLCIQLIIQITQIDGCENKYSECIYRGYAIQYAQKGFEISKNYQI